MMKLGKRAPVRLLKTPALGDYMTPAVTWPAVPPTAWEAALPAANIGMLGNDRVGNCVIAAMMHYAANETANTDNPLTATTEQALDTYSAITGYDPKDAATDRGTTWIEALCYWKANGIPMLDRNGKEVRHTILGWAALDLASIAQQRYACYTFGGTLMGIQCPQSAMDDMTDWRYNAKSPSLGGHGINRTGQGAAGWHINSWGRSIPGTWEFSLHLADEDYAVVTPFWLNKQQKSPSGLELNELVTAMRAL